MRLGRIPERVAWVTGVLLLTFYGAARLHGGLGKQQDLERFNEAREQVRAMHAIEAARPVLGSTLQIDTTLWSDKRISAYHETLEHELSPPMAVLYVPSIDLEVPVLEGTDEITLNRAVGRIEGTALPGEPGNLGIAGHRDGYFRGLKDLAEGDTIELHTLLGTDHYRVDAIDIVYPADVEVLDPTPEPSLTLVTCYPFYYVGSAPQRYIVRATRTRSVD